MSALIDKGLLSATGGGAFSMKTKIALAVSVVFLLFISAIFVITLRYFRNHFEETLFKQQTALVTAIASSVDSKLRAAQGALARFADEIPPDIFSDADKAQALLDRQQALLSIFDNALVLVKTDGHIFVDSPRSANRRGLDVSQYDVFTGVSETGKPHISKPFSSVGAKGRPVVAIGIPLYDRRGNMFGRLQGSFQLLGKNVLADLLELKIGASGYLYLVDLNRTMILHTNRERIMGPPVAPGQNRLLDRAVEGFEGSGRTVTSFGLNVLSSFKRLDTTPWILAVNYPEEEAFAPFREAAKTVVWLFAAGTAAVLLIVWLLMRRLIGPLAAMTAHVAALPSKRGEARFLRPTARDEVGMLGQKFDQMLGELDAKERTLRDINATLEQRVTERTRELEQALETVARAQDELIRSEKLAALGSLVAGIAHELNTPLGNALTVASTLRDKNELFLQETGAGTVKRSSLDTYMANSLQGSTLIMHNLERAVELVTSFKQVAVDQTSAQRRSFDLREMIEELLSTLQHLVKNKPIRLVTHLADGVQMDGYPGPLGQVINNLFNNALLHGFAGRAGGEIVIETRRADDDRVVIEFRDDGNGIAPEHLARIFDPFFTTRLGQGGSGLGLNITHNIVTKLLGGRIEVASVRGDGACFTLVLPRVGPLETAGAVAAERE